MINIRILNSYTQQSYSLINNPLTKSLWTLEICRILRWVHRKKNEADKTKIELSFFWAQRISFVLFCFFVNISHDQDLQIFSSDYHWAHSKYFSQQLIATIVSSHIFVEYGAPKNQINIYEKNTSNSIILIVFLSAPRFLDVLALSSYSFLSLFLNRNWHWIPFNQLFVVELKRIQYQTKLSM